MLFTSISDISLTFTTCWMRRAQKVAVCLVLVSLTSEEKSEKCLIIHFLTLLQRGSLPYITCTIYHAAGDEVLAVNGLALQGMSHSEAISVFKNIRSGRVVLHVARRDAATRR